MPFPTSSFARSGRFSEIYPIGRGAAGQVYSALDNLGRRVAVKEALPAVEGFAAMRAKFEQEARLQAAIDHPRIVRVFHLEEDPATRELYLIAELADRGSLAELLEREGPLPEARALALALDVCAALQETERHRIVHRDVKPSNVLLFQAPDGGLVAKLADFGIAQDTRQRKTTVLPGASHPGTPLYMAPEQADATAVLDTRADIFALGVTLWELLTGEDYKYLLRDGAGPTLHSYSPGASAAIAQVIARAVRADRSERYQTPRALADDLRRVLHGEPPVPETLALAPPVPMPRPLNPLAWVGALGPIAVTLLLLFGSMVVTAAMVALVSFMVQAFGGGEPIVVPTSPPAFFENDTGVSGPTPDSNLPPGPAPTAPPAGELIGPTPAGSPTGELIGPTPAAPNAPATP